MATTVKRSITIDDDLDQELTARFPPGERSRFINDATRAALARVRLRELLDEMEAADPIPADDPMREEIARLPIPR
jgi:metal-responsive CopG/Arc/MetJ family transcriptional regulator